MVLMRTCLQLPGGVPKLLLRSPKRRSSGGPLKSHQTFVDGKQEAVLIPIHGRLVPFHISTVKNVSKSEEGGWTFLRINFVAPGASIASLLSSSR